MRDNTFSLTFTHRDVDGETLANVVREMIGAAQAAAAINGVPMDAGVTLTLPLRMYHYLTCKFAEPVSLHSAGAPRTLAQTLVWVFPGLTILGEPDYRGTGGP